MKLRHSLGSEKGTSTLEFAVVVPFLMIVFVVGAELSRAWFTANIVQNAVREGARMGAVTPVSPDPPYNMTTWAQTVTDRINGILPSSLTVVSGPSATCDHNPCQPDDRVQTEVTVLFHSLIGLIPDINIHQTATMRYE